MEDFFKNHFRFISSEKLNFCMKIMIFRLKNYLDVSDLPPEILFLQKIAIFLNLIYFIEISSNFTSKIA